jgi:hypothetical protein
VTGTGLSSFAHLVEFSIGVMAPDDTAGVFAVTPKDILGDEPG